MKIYYIDETDLEIKEKNYEFEYLTYKNIDYLDSKHMIGWCICKENLEFMKNDI